MDLGANVGFFTVVLASLVGEAGHVHAFEPLPENADLLARSLAENRFEKRVTLHRAAVADAPGTSAFTIARERRNSGGGHLERDAAARPVGAEVLEVPVVRLDDVDLGGRVTFMKVDVEGAEVLALRGARRVLAESRPIVVAELNGRQLGLVSKSTPGAFVQEVEALGYESFELAAGRLVPHDRRFDRPGVSTVVFVPAAPSPVRDRVAAPIGAPAPGGR